MGIGIDRFLPWENGVQATATGIWSLGMGKNVKNKKNGKEVGALRRGISKTNVLGNGIGTPSGSFNNNFIYTLCIFFYLSKAINFQVG